jgi:rod shape-determining protein MreD
MWLRQAALCASVLLIILLLQLTLLARLGLPGSTPDLIAVSVVAISFAYGPGVGSAYGFAAGMALDFSPAMDGTIGLHALIYLVIGALAGPLIDTRDRSVPVVMAVVAVAAGSVPLVVAILETALGNERIDWGQVPIMVITGALYGVILAPLVLPPIGWLVKKLTPEALL